MPRIYPTPCLDFLKAALLIETDECQIWPFGRDTHDYGTVRFRKRDYRVHRVALILTKPDFDESKCSLHTCDNPPCFNPRHLFEGTKKDNADDMCKKGRHGKTPIHGEAHYEGKLTDAKVKEIRLRLMAKQSHQSIADEFGVCRQNITGINLGRIWKHVH